MASFRVIILCHWNGQLHERDKTVDYVGGKHKLVLCKSKMTLNELKQHICSKVGFDSRSSGVTLKFKYGIHGSFLVFPIDDDEDLEAMWAYAQLTNKNSVEVFVEGEVLETQNFQSLSNFVQKQRRFPLNLCYLTNLIRNCVVKDPSTRISFILQMVKDKCHIEVSYMWAWYAKQQAIADLYGGWEDSYALLPHFLKAMQQTNPGTVVEWFYKEHNDRGVSNGNTTRTFKRVFWAFRPSIEGFTYCKPVIAIDSTNLFGKYRHTFLVAIAQDGNKQIFPLAFALVEKECVAAWYWFLSCIRRHVTQRTGICIISDRHAGIMASMQHSEWLPPYAHHRFCVRHLVSNFNLHHEDVQLKKLFVRTAEQRQHHKVNEGLEHITQLKPEARKWIAEVGDMDKWSISYDGGYRYGVTNTNLDEFFNSMMKGVRFLPVTTIVEISFYRINEYFVNKRESSCTWKDHGNVYAFHATQIIAQNTHKAKFHEVIPFEMQQGIYQVKTGRGTRDTSKGGKYHTVNMQSSICTCNKLDIYHLPCSHVLAVCMKTHISYSTFVDPCYTSENYANTYKSYFMPMIDKRAWPPYDGVKLRHDPEQICNSGSLRSKRTANEMDGSTNNNIV